MNVTPSTPTRLYLLQLALIEDGMPIPGYLIQTSDGKNILVDTGPPRDGTYVALDNMSVQIEDVVEILTTLGLTPRDIDLLVCTHFDSDHSGNHDQFPWSELIVQRTHYEAAHATMNERWTITRSHWDHPSLHYRLVDGDTELVPGVELIETSGHVPGHQAVLVRLPQTGPILLAIDAAAFEADFDPEIRMEDLVGEMDAAGVYASIRKLVELAKREGVTLVVFGHDTQQWETLKKAPEFYG
jgi:N-acyl homoserine lactone hydrolase